MRRERNRGAHTLTIGTQNWYKGGGGGGGGEDLQSSK